MDKSQNYRQLIKQILHRYETLARRQGQTDPQDIFLFDEERDNYAWVKFGWTARGRLESVTTCVALRDGKFYLEEDLTENGIANDLVAAGVPKSDIVLAFQPPEMRPYTDFALG